MEGWGGMIRIEVSGSILPNPIEEALYRTVELDLSIRNGNDGWFMGELLRQIEIEIEMLDDRTSFSKDFGLWAYAATPNLAIRISSYSSYARFLHPFHLLRLA
jgi:hypothetical protein